MSSSNSHLKTISRRGVLLAPLALAACGFTPIYGRGSAAEALNGKIALGEVDSRLTFEFYEQLENRLGRANAPLFQLDVALSIASKGLAITQDNAITRYNLTGEARFTLTRIADDAADDTIVLEDLIRAFTAYSATASAYATQVSKRDAERRLAISLADQIATRIASSAESFGL